MMTVSVVVPTLNERVALPALVAQLRAEPGPVEIVIGDGGSRDGTVEWARAAGLRVVELQGGLGRGAQMNAAAAAAEGDALWFLHADSRIVPGSTELIRRVFRSANSHAGAFRFGLDSAGLAARLIEVGTRIRSEWFSFPYGDQGYFVRRATFERVGGFAGVPIMEDVYFLRRLAAHGVVLRVRPVPLYTSPRRWQRLGAWRVTLINAIVIGLDLLGVRPSRLAALYRGAVARHVKASSASSSRPSVPERG